VNISVKGFQQVSFYDHFEKKSGYSMQTRRQFLKTAVGAGGLLLFGPDTIVSTPRENGGTHLGASTVYRAFNGTPDKNMSKVIELMGGIQNLIGIDDVVLIKPNVQWWNQGAPNLLAMKTFVDIIMERPGGFRGEVIIAENCHRGIRPWESLSSGWAQRFAWNADIPLVINMNGLCAVLKKSYGERFSAVHWINVSHSGRRVFSPADGDGYVYCDGTGGLSLLACGNGLQDEQFRETIMTYPLFTSDKGTRIDFKYGIWNKGSYTDVPLKFINFSALNHHSTYCGATSAVKNYMGVTDLSGGPDPHNRGRLTGKYYNFHSFPFNQWAPGPEPGMLGMEIGMFMKTIRKADLNITTAEWTGLSSRTDPPMAHTRAVLASKDPVSLDYHSTKYILYPNSRIPFHNPDEKKGPLNQYLTKCAEAGDCALPAGSDRTLSYDFMVNAIQEGKDLAIYGEKTWGSSFKPILKYLYMKYAGQFYIS
jgi:hypothetical protein